MRFRGISQLVLTVGLLIFVAACGAAGGDEQTATASGDPVASGTTTAVAPDTTEPDPTTPGGDEPGSGDLSGLPEMSGGSATFTLAGETEEFDWFVCFYGDAVAVLEVDEDLTFLGVGRRGGSFPSMDGVEAQIVTSRSELLDGLNYTILYTRIGSDGAQTNWQGGGFDVLEGEDLVIIDGDRVTFEGELSPIIDNEERDEASEMGALDATCSPNSIGSDE